TYPAAAMYIQNRSTFGTQDHQLPPSILGKDTSVTLSPTAAKVMAVNTAIKMKISFHRCLVDRKSTRLNSSHVKISYAVFCLKKKKKTRKKKNNSNETTLQTM